MRYTGSKTVVNKPIQNKEKVDFSKTSGKNAFDNRNWELRENLDKDIIARIVGELERYYSKRFFIAFNEEHIPQDHIICPHCKFPIFRANNAAVKKVVNGMIHPSNKYKDVLCCELCKTVFVPHQPPKGNPVRDFSDKRTPIFVCGYDKYKGVYDVKSYDGIVIDEKGKQHVIKVCYVIDKNKFYILLSQLENLHELYGVLKAKFVSDTVIVKGHEVEEYSPLRLYGYTVNNNIGLTQKERQTILANIIKMGIMDRGKIKFYLSLNIKKANGQAKMINAIKKWQDDLNWL